MYLDQNERNFVKTTKLHEVLENLTSCGLYVHEVDGITAASRLCEVSVAMVKVCALALSHGVGQDGTICSALDCSNPMTLALDPTDVGTALCGVAALLEYGTDLAEVTRDMALDDVPAPTETDVSAPVEADATAANIDGGEAESVTPTPSSATVRTAKVAT